jgi:phage-related protein
MKDLIWIGTSLDDLKEFPDDAIDTIGYALHEVQEGFKPIKGKPLTGIGSGVMEIICDFDSNTYRAVYVLKLGDVIYVLHCFQKKLKIEITTPKKDIDLIKARFNDSQQLYKKRGK